MWDLSNSPNFIPSKTIWRVIRQIFLPSKFPSIRYRKRKKESQTVCETVGRETNDHKQNSIAIVAVLSAYIADHNCDWICKKESSTHIQFCELEGHNAHINLHDLTYVGTHFCPNFKLMAVFNLKLWIVKVGELDVWGRPLFANQVTILHSGGNIEQP